MIGMIKFPTLIVLYFFSSLLAAQEQNLTPVVFGPRVVSEGDVFELQITMANFNTDEITSVNTEQEQDIQFNNGVAIVRYKADQTSMDLRGDITIKSNGKEITRNWEHFVAVMKHSAQVGNDLPYLYRGIENKIEAVAMGFPSTKATGTGIVLTKKEDGYYGYPDAKSDTVVVSVYGIQPWGEEVFIKKQRFRVLNVPAPILKLNGAKSGNEVSIDTLLLEAKLDDSAPIKADFDIESWDVFSNGKRITGSGNDLSGAKKNIKSSIFYLLGGPGLGAMGPFRSMGNISWVILGFRSRKCTRTFLLGHRSSDFRLDAHVSLYKRYNNTYCHRFLIFFESFWSPGRLRWQPTWSRLESLAF